MTMRCLRLSGTVGLAVMSGVAACAEPQGTATVGGQVVTTLSRPGDQPSRDDWLISPNDPRYQANGAPRVGEKPLRNAPYAPIHGNGSSG
jgi:hypothetical protein